MTVQELIDFLQDVENKELPVVLMGEGGFYSPCVEESDSALNEQGDEVFALLPCYGHEDIEMDVRPEDFEINEN